jgi:hypothetical protein
MDVHLVSPGTLKLRNLSFLGSDQMDNLRQDHTEVQAPVRQRLAI